MKKLLIAASLALAFGPLSALASTTNFSPATVSVQPGQTFSQSVIITPSVKSYTVKLAVSYPAALLEVVSFTFASNWLPVTQPGYDLIDNTGGNLTKTAGYAGGFGSATTLGTITFRAKAAGDASVSVTPSIQILDANNANTFTSGGRSSVSIAAPVALPVVTVPKTTPATPAKPTSNPARNVSSTQTITTAATTTVASTTATSTPATSTSLQASAYASNANSQSMAIGLGAVATLLGFALGFTLGKRKVV